MDCTGGAYLSMPYTNSEAVRKSLYWPAAPSTKSHTLLQREPYAPYALSQGHSRPRITSAPVTKPYYPAHKEVGPTNPHRSYSSFTSKPIESEVTRHAPYASRLHDDSFFYTPQCHSRPTGGLYGYSSICDPHLEDYFSKKFACVPRPPSGQPRRSRPGSAASKNSRLKRKDQTEVLYKVAVTTGNRKNAGTDAKVYITLKGSKGKLPKKLMTKKASSTKSKKKIKFKFNKGTTHIFKFTAKDIGELMSIHVEHDGLTREQGWYLEQVEVAKKPKSGKEKIWIFMCQRWLSLHEGDCQIARELYAKASSKTVYEVVVVTGNLKGAGTDANVFVTLFGKTGQTPKLQLKNNSKDTFERNQSDIFQLKTHYVGPMTKIRIQHDNTGFGPGWYLDRVVVTDTSNPKLKYFFPCGQWLAKDEGDGLICRDLLGSRDPLAVRKVNKYKVTVYTGNKRGAGTDANVYITIFGQMGDSSEKRLDSSKNNFEKGKVDEFMLESPALGTLQRVRIGHDNSAPSAGWFLDKVIVDDLENNRVYEFPCNRWLAKDEDDGNISRDLICGVGPMDAAPGVPYTILVTTGDVSNAATSARVFIILFGGKDGHKSSGKIWLENGDFKRGRTDIFNVDVAENLGTLSRIEIGHDNSGPGPGWYLDRVVVKCPSAGIEQWFMCDKWLALDEGDGVIERTLYEEKGRRKESKKLVTWYVWVTTTDVRCGGTDANIHLVAYGKTKDGEYKKSDEIPLENKGDNFEAGHVDNFKIEMDEIGKPYKIRVGHDGTGVFAGWHLDKIEMENMATKKRYMFKCNRWLAEDEDDCATVREMPAEGEDIKKPQPLLQYQADVYTGSKMTAGTDADVFLNVFGEQGDTGERSLVKSQAHVNKFERNNVDTFILEAVSLKKLKKIRVGHNGKNPGSGWFLDKVVVKQLDDPSTETVFGCNRWLDINEDDGLIVREITAGGSQMLSTTSYHVSVRTGDIWGGGTDANVYIKLFGEKGDTGEMDLRNSDNTMNKFERGRRDLFKLEATDIGKIEKIRIGHDGSAPGSGWFLDGVNVDVPSKGERYIFACHRWLDTKEEDGLLEIELEPSHVERGASKIPYELTVWTGDVRGAGTDANVFIQMYGELGKSEELQLRNRTDNFEQGEVDKFKVEAEDVGPLLKVRVGHDGAGAFAGWYLEKILIQRHPTKASKRRRRRSLRPSSSIKTVKRSAVESESEEDIRSVRSSSWRRQPPRKESDWDTRSTRSRSAGGFKRYKDDSDEDIYPRRSRPGSARRKNRDDSDDDTRSKRGRAGNAKKKSNDDSDDDRRSKYKGFFGGKKKSQPDSDESDDDLVRGGNARRPSSRLSARSGKSRQPRDLSDEDDKRKKRSKNRYNNIYDSDDESVLRQKRRKNQGRKNQEISDNSEDERDARKGRGNKKKKNFLRKYDEEKENDEPDVEDYWFVCNRWFAKGEDDGKIIRELLPTDERGNPLETGLKEVEYGVKVYTGDVFGAGTDANVFINITGEFGDTGERQLSQANHINKFEKDQEDIFKLKAVELGRLKKVKIRHDNKGGGAAWFLGHVQIEDPASREVYFFPCQRWLAKNEDDGQIARELVPVDKSLMSKSGGKAIRNEVALETKAAMTTYHVYVHTGDKFGAGTDANVHIILYGEIDDTGVVNLKSSKTNRDKFERNNMDEFVIEAVDIGELKKIKIAHDNAGGGADWYLDKVEIDCPSLGKKWYFPCCRWLAKGKDDGQLERELYPQEVATEEYIPYFPKRPSSNEEGVPYEITTYTSDIGSASTSADVYVVLYGRETCTVQRSLCSSKAEKKKSFQRGAVDKFVLEMEDVGETIEKLRIGHDGKGFGAGWHLAKVEVRRLKEGGKEAQTGSETYSFKCGRWLAKDEDDGAIVRELVPEKLIEETARKDGTMRKKELSMKDTLKSKDYIVNVYTGDVKGGGTDANVFISIFGDKGDSGERKLANSETYRDKFERSQTDRFCLEAVDLGRLYKVRIRHDNSLFNPAWFLNKVEVIDKVENETYVFHCERWLGKNKEDGKIDRNLYVKGYDGDMSSTSTLRSHRIGGSVASLDSIRSSDPFSKSPRISRRQLEEIPEGPTIPYTVRVTTGSEKDMGTDSDVWIKIMGKKSLQSGKLFLELAQKSSFLPGSVETFSLEAADVKEVKAIELGHNGVVPGSGWFVNEVEVDLPTKGRHYFFTCKSWLARDKSDGKTSRLFTLNEGEKSVLSYKPMVPYEVTVYTGDVQDAGTNAQIFIKMFGANGASSEVKLDKSSERFERGRSDFLKIELEDIGELKKLRIGHDGKGDRPDWFLDKVEVRRMDTGSLATFHAKKWFSKSRDDGIIVRDIVATVKGKTQLKRTNYSIHVKTSDVRGAGTNANVFLVLFGENGDSGEVHLKDSETNSSPFENNQLDTFILTDMLSLGQLTKARVWHDNKGLGSAWHLQHIEVEDQAGKKKYMFPCNRWLSRNTDDKQICRELSCANLTSPGTKEKITYEIEVTTHDKKDAGMIHNAWLVLEGDQKTSKDFIMENSTRNKILRRGQTDNFTMVSRNLGSLKRCILGACERDDKPLGGAEGRDAQWLCHEVAVTNKTTGDRYVFPSKSWIPITRNISQRNANVLQVKSVEESMMTSLRNLGSVKYEVIVVTGDIRSAGTDANVFITLFGTHGDTGKRPLTQKFRDLFERNQTDRFQIEAIDLGDLNKIYIEHDNAGFGAGWFLDRVEVINMATSHTWLFPCGQWLDKKKGDGEIARELLARD